MKSRGGGWGGKKTCSKGHFVIIFSLLTAIFLPFLS